jgi:hypothetical protein
MDDQKVVYVLDDDVDIRSALERLLNTHGYLASRAPRAGSSPPSLHRVRSTAQWPRGRGCHVPAHRPSTGVILRTVQPSV